MYVHFAISEERRAEQEFGRAWRDYAAHTPRFFPRFGASRLAPVTRGHP